MSPATFNASTFSPGDTIDISSKGGPIATSLIIPSSGTSANPIVLQSEDGATLAGSPNNPSIQGDSINYITLNRLKLIEEVLINTGTGWTFNYCWIKNNVLPAGIYCGSAPNTSINNCLFPGLHDYATSNDGPSTSVNSLNCAILGCNYYGYQAYSGTVNIDYSMVAGNGYYPIDNLPAGSGITIGSHNQQEINPLIVSYPGPQPMFVLTSDDNDVNYWMSLSNLCANHGINMSIFGIWGDIDTALTSLTLMHNAGQEVSLHTWSHADLTSTYLFRISTTNLNPSIDISRSARTLTLNCSNPSNNVQVDWSSTNKRAFMILKMQ